LIDENTKGMTLKEAHEMLEKTKRTNYYLNQIDANAMNEHSTF